MRPTTGTAVRAALVAGFAAVGGVVLWRLRPALSAGSAPDADIVLACTWLAWGLAGYLVTAVAATSLAHLGAAFGLASQSLARIAPSRLRRVIDALVTLSVAASIVGTGASAAVAAPRAGADPVVATQSVNGSQLDGSGLDWPGLGAASTPVAPSHAPAPQPADAVLVRPGDTLWSIAARHLPTGASGALITRAWHAWYDANRTVIGPNPSVIHPGQRLVAPGRLPSTPGQDIK
jgi:LysM repeat protein